MKVFMIGGTGLLGSIAAKKLIEEGHFVTSLALPPIPKGAGIPSEMQLILKNFMLLDDEELIKHMENSQVFVFAAGIDERVEGKPPVYDLYYNFNIKALERLIKLAKKAGIKKTIVLGSYFSYFNREWPELKLAENNPYIRSRVDQEKMVMSYADKDMKISILELPYIFGTQPGRKPVWTILINHIRKMKLFTFYPKGGTAMITVDQVGELIKTVCLNDAEEVIPVGYYNISWNEMLIIFHQEMKVKRRIINIPKWLYKLSLSFVKLGYKKRGIESGLNFNSLAEIMSREAYIDNTYLKEELKIPEADIFAAIRESTKLSLEVIKDDEEIVVMRAE